MCIVRTQHDVSEFYRKALAEGTQTAERLCAPVSDRFAGFLHGISADAPRTALELGYGMGTYSLALARSGFTVVAVDQVPARIFRSRLSANPDWLKHIDVVEQRVESCSVIGNFGLVIAKDVLHYLRQDQVRELLTRCIQRAPAAAGHFLEVFTDITRTDRRGHGVMIDGEAAYTAAGFRDLIERLYSGWAIHTTLSPHAERDTETARNYFEANRITVCAYRHTGTGALR
ncbi:methyltransferase domain-containing protein [Nocardia sp. NPDC049149]|uniref:methyltransferase domain-containing protein n=1 Tax=Nocardia sp. NPDC049149 TaxID=3364315 RepID=UPI003714FCB3